MVINRYFRTAWHEYFWQLLTALTLLFWRGLSFANASFQTTDSNPRVYLYWFLALFACLLAGYFMGSKRRMDEEHYQTAIEKKLSLSESRLSKQQAALAKLTQNQLKDWQDPVDVFREIAKISAETLDVERVAIWIFSNNNQQLECMDLYLKSKNLHTVAKPLQARDLPIYFSHLAKHRVIAAHDVMQHASTVEFTTGYVQENNIVMV